MLNEGLLMYSSAFSVLNISPLAPMGVGLELVPFSFFFSPVAEEANECKSCL